MVKYAGRGLVNDQHNLFRKLYFVCASTMHVFFYVQIIVSHIQKDHDDVFYMKMCLSKIKSDVDITSYFRIGIALCIITFTVSSIFSFSVKYFVDSRSNNNNGNIPAIFGRFQRNIVTLTQTTLFLNFLFLLAIIEIFSLLYFKSVASDFVILFGIFMFPNFILFKFFNNNHILNENIVHPVRVFYISKPELIAPRRDTEQKDLEQNLPSSSRIIFVKEKL